MARLLTPEASTQQAHQNRYQAALQALAQARLTKHALPKQVLNGQLNTVGTYIAQESHDSQIAAKKTTCFEMAYPVTNNNLLLEVRLQTRCRVVFARYVQILAALKGPGRSYTLTPYSCCTHWQVNLSSLSVAHGDTYNGCTLQLLRGWGHDMALATQWVGP